MTAWQKVWLTVLFVWAFILGLWAGLLLWSR